MAAVLWVWGIIALAYAVIILALAKSAIHEIEVGVAFLIATVSFGCSGILEELQRMRTVLKEALLRGGDAKELRGEASREELEDAVTRATIRRYEQKSQQEGK